MGIGDWGLGIGDWGLGYREAPRADGRKNVAPRVFKTELFVNGAYTGLAEWAERIDGDMTGEKDDVFFRHAVARPRDPPMRQIRPPLADEDLEGRYRELCEVFSEPPSPDWREKAERMLDLDGVADYQLLLNLFQNTNIGDGNFAFMEYLAWRRGRQDSQSSIEDGAYEHN